MSQRWTEVGDRVFVRRYDVLRPGHRRDPGRRRGADRRHPVHPGAGARDPRRPARARARRRSASSSTPTATATTPSATRVFRPAVIWGHERCATMVRHHRRGAALDGRPTRCRSSPPSSPTSCSIPRRSRSPIAPSIDLDGRAIELAYLGRGHTDNDIVIRDPRRRRPVRRRPASRTARRRRSATGTRWTGRRRVEALLALVGERTVVVPGHGDHAGSRVRRGVARGDPGDRARSARGSSAGELSLEDAVDGGALSGAPRPARRSSGRWPSCEASSTPDRRGRA